MYAEVMFNPVAGVLVVNANPVPPNE